jgi:hypothetical protein
MVAPSTSGGEVEASPEVQRAIEGSRGGGQALDSGVRRRMEVVLGTDFGGVRVHTDAKADSLNRALSAKAFTAGGDIYFREQEYRPGTAAGEELLAHELTHVAQQGGGPAGGPMVIGDPDDAYEREADAVSHAYGREEGSFIASREGAAVAPAATPAAAGRIQRQPDGPTKYNPPAGVVASGQLQGQVGVVDVGDTSGIQDAILALLPSPFKEPGAQGKVAARWFTNDNIQSNIVNMTKGTPLAYGGITATDAMAEYYADIAVTARASNFDFVRADEIAVAGVGSTSSVSGGSSGNLGHSQTFGAEGGGGVGGHEGGPSASGKVSASAGETTGATSTGSMGGSVSRGTGAAPDSVLFTCAISYIIEVTYSRSPRTWTSIASLGLANLASEIIDENYQYFNFFYGTGAQVRYPGADCPPAG